MTRWKRYFEQKFSREFLLKVPFRVCKKNVISIRCCFSVLYKKPPKFAKFGPRRVLFQKIACIWAEKCQFIQQKMLLATWTVILLCSVPFSYSFAIRGGRTAIKAAPTSKPLGPILYGFRHSLPLGRVREGRYLYINVVHLSGAMMSAAACWICSAVTASTFS